MTFPEPKPPKPLGLESTYYLSQALFWVAASLPLALSVLLMQARGLNLLQVGTLLGVYSLAVAVFEFPSGTMADAIGRKRIALLGYGVTVVALVSILLSFTFTSFLFGWLLMGVGRAYASGSLQAWFIDGLLDSDPNVDIQPPLARAGTFELLALAVGTLGGSYLPTLFTFLPEEGTAVLTPFSVPVLASAVVMVVLMLFVAFMVREARRPVQIEGAGVRRLPRVVVEACRAVQTNRMLPPLLLSTFAGGFMLSGLETFWQPHFAALLGGAEGNTPVFGVVLAGCFFAGMLGNLASIRVSGWVGGRHAVVAGTFFCLSGALLIVLALQGSVVASVALFWLVYFSRSVGTSPHAALFNRQVPGEQRSTLLSFQSLVMYGGFFAGSMTLGYLAESVSTNAAWVVAGAVMTLSAAVYVRVARHHDRQEHPSVGSY